MRRFFAAVLLMCLLLTMTTAVFAEPAETELPKQDSADGTQDDVPEEEPEPAQTPEEEATPTEEETDPLSGETAMRRVEITGIVSEKGTATISMVIQMNVVGVTEQLRFALPENAKNREVTGWKAKSSVENGQRYLTITNDSGFSGAQSFTVTYTLSGLVSGGTQSQKLDLPLLAAQDYRVGQVALAVNLPKTFTTYPSFTSGYYGEIIEDYMDFSTSGKAVVGTVNVILQDSDSLRMSLTVPEDYFSVRNSDGLLAKILTVLVVVLLALALVYWWRTLHSTPLRPQTRTLPPDGVNPGDMPFLLAGGAADFNMLVSYWATLGYLSFYVNKAGHVILRRCMPMGNERRPYERKLFDLLFAGDELCDGASIRYKKVGERAMAVLPRYWGKRLFDRQSGSPFLAKLLCCLASACALAAAMDALGPDKVHGLFVLAGLIAGFALCWMMQSAFGRYYLSDWVRVAIGCCCGLLLLILGGLGGIALTMAPTVAVSALIGWQTTHGGRRSAYGQEVIRQTMGFRQFLLHASEHHLQQMLRRDPEYFYKMLPYAESMGLGSRFVAMFHDARLEPCPWYESARGTATTAGAFYDQYLDALDLLNISIQR